MRFFRSITALFIAGVFMFAGCASTPKGTLDLAEIVDQQIAEMQKSHEKFVRLYYSKLRDEAENFLVTRWTPQFLANVIEGTDAESQRFRADLDQAYKLANVDWNTAISVKENDPKVQQALREAVKEMTQRNNAVLGMVLLKFSRAVQVEIENRRKQLRAPIDEQEAYVLDELREGYTNLLRGSTAIKAHLVSVVKINEQREQVLEKVGALNAQKRLVNAAVELSDGAAKALQVAGKAEDAIGGFVKSMQDAKAKISAIKGKGN